jgi:hypothetical protein
MTELIRITADYDPSRALKNWNTTGDIALCSFVDYGQIEQILLQRQNIVDIGQIYQPDRERSEQNPEVDLLEEVFLLNTRARSYGPEKKAELLAVSAERVSQATAVQTLNK